MPRFPIIGLLFFIILTLSGCSHRLQIEEALEGGAHQLSGSEIKEKLANSTLKLTSWDDLYEAEVKLFADGSLKAVNSKGERDRGNWRISDDRLCLKFKRWLPDEITCYKLTKDNNTYQLFGKTGGHEFTFEITEKSTLKSQKKATDNEDGFLSFLLPSGKDGEVSTEEAKKTGQLLKAELRHLLEDKECLGCNLRGEDLSGLDLDGADLANADLAGADLSGASLRDSNLTGINLSEANLKEADLREAVLKNSSLSGADLEMALLEEADLEGADLSDARLVDADLEEANLSKANLKGADLHWALLREANLKGADLEGAYLVKADFQEADLTGANLSGAVIQRTNFKDTVGMEESSP